MTRRLDHQRCSRVKRTNPEADRRELENNLAIDGMIELLDQPGLTEAIRGTIHFHLKRLQGGARARSTLLEDLLMMIAKERASEGRRGNSRKKRKPRAPRKPRETR